MSKGLENIPVRFFIWDDECHHDYDDTCGDFAECTEAEFIAANVNIEYERDTVFANGASQICLTKNPF